MANVSIKNLPDRVHAVERARRARMRASRNVFRRFVKSLPYIGDGTELIREDREHGH